MINILTEVSIMYCLWTENGKKLLEKHFGNIGYVYVLFDKFQLLVINLSTSIRLRRVLPFEHTVLLKSITKQYR